MHVCVCLSVCVRLYVCVCVCARARAHKHPHTQPSPNPYLRRAPHNKLLHVKCVMVHNAIIGGNQLGDGANPHLRECVARQDCESLFAK